MVHHRWVASGEGSDQPHQPAATGAAVNCSSSFVGSSTPTGSEQGGISAKAYHEITTGGPPAASNGGHVNELRGNTPSAAEDGSRRRELPWRKKKHLLGKVALVAVAGTAVKKSAHASTVLLLSTQPLLWFYTHV